MDRRQPRIAACAAASRHRYSKCQTPSASPVLRPQRRIRSPYVLRADSSIGKQRWRQRHRSTSANQEIAALLGSSLVVDRCVQQGHRILFLRLRTLPFETPLDEGMFPWRPEGVEVEEKTHGRLISWSATRYTASCQGHPVGSMSAWAFLTTTVNFSWLVLNSP